ncbi:hypothetical protein T7987_17090 (plasmid) [Sulfitobacter faviae]|uniref:O-antigen ligase like membrane protein n=1 Tax=Sulfitobacter faviae TaxID=1775881 RepID=A0ABZ0V400_9RHOB|nr:hypothetical protein [Sulfitobacter faviae]WPZ23588.1 hypothetical protein T7987_17090 [Sulfitobacter faviae]
MASHQKLNIEPSSSAPRAARGKFALRQATSLIIIFTILFPYARVLPVNTDIQPNFLIAILLLGPFVITVRMKEVIVFTIFVALLILYTIAEPTSQSFRAWPAYLTPLLVMVFVRAMLTSEANGRWLDRLMYMTFYPWVGFGVLQLLSGSLILVTTFRASTTTNRGWTSFAPEPSAFGTVLFLYAAFFAARGRPALAVVALLTTALAAQSALGLVYFAILALAYLLLHITKQARWLLPISAFLILLTVVVDMRDILEILPDGSRVTTLVNHAIVSGSIQEDNSVSSRVSDLISAMSAVTEGSMLGEGFGGEKRLKSGWGAYAYELGWLGLTIAIGWIGYFLFRAKQMGRNVLASTGAIIVMLFSSTPLAMPFASFVIAALIYAPASAEG